VIGAVLVLAEIVMGAASGFDFLLIGTAVLAGGVLGLVFHSPALGLAAAGALSLIYVLVGRRRIRAKLQRPGIPSNTDALLGRVARVSEPIAAHRPGRIRVEGEEWRATVDDAAAGVLEIGCDVTISRIDGVTAHVVPVEPAQAGGGSKS
jgi:membrane protein implicated in regulation of membrane protease activity